MDLLQEAFVHPPESCEARSTVDQSTLFDVFWTIGKNKKDCKSQDKSYIPRMP